MNHGKKLTPRPVFLFLLFLADDPSKLWHLRRNQSSDTEGKAAQL